MLLHGWPCQIQTLTLVCVFEYDLIFAGHSLRATGAKFFINAGGSVGSLMVEGCWASLNAVRAYWHESTFHVHQPLFIIPLITPPKTQKMCTLDKYHYDMHHENQPVSPPVCDGCKCDQMNCFVMFAFCSFFSGIYFLDMLQFFGLILISIRFIVFFFTHSVLLLC